MLEVAGYIQQNLLLLWAIYRNHILAFIFTVACMYLADFLLYTIYYFLHITLFSGFGFYFSNGKIENMKSNVHCRV